MDFPFRILIRGALPTLPEPLKGHGRAWLAWAGSPTEPYRTLQRVWKGMVGLDWVGPGARPSLTAPFKGYGRAWLGLVGLGREPDRALPNPSKGMAGHG